MSDATCITPLEATSRRAGDAGRVSGRRTAPDQRESKGTYEPPRSVLEQHSCYPPSQRRRSRPWRADEDQRVIVHGSRGSPQGRVKNDWHDLRRGGRVGEIAQWQETEKRTSSTRLVWGGERALHSGARHREQRRHLMHNVVELRVLHPLHGSPDNSIAPSQKSSIPGASLPGLTLQASGSPLIGLRQSAQPQ